MALEMDSGFFGGLALPHLKGKSVCFRAKRSYTAFLDLEFTCLLAGPPDTMRDGFQSFQHGVAPSHPVQQIVVQVWPLSC
jgi:hypothetical protein